VRVEGSRSADPPISVGTDSASALAARVAGGDGTVLGREGRQPSVPVGWKLSHHRALELSGELGVGDPVAIHCLLPSAAQLRATRTDLVEFALCLFRHIKGLILRPVVCTLGQSHFLGAERLAVGLERVLLVRTAESDVRARHDERRPALLGARRRERRVHRRYVHPVHVLHVPAVRGEARPHVFRERDVGRR
jgi:hypothetical protein